MASAVDDKSWIPKVDGGKAPVAIGSSLRKLLRQRKGIQERPSKVPDHEYFAFKYRFKPQNIDTSKPAVLERPGGEGMWSLTRPNTKDENVTWAGGELSSKKGELMCVLIYDESVGTFTLERLDTHMTLQHLPAASTGPPASMAAARQNLKKTQVKNQAARTLDAELEAQLMGDDDDADGSDDMEAVPIASTSNGTRHSNKQSEDDFADLLRQSRTPSAPGMGKGVALAQAEAAKIKAAKAAKAAKVKSNGAGPAAASLASRGKKRSSEEVVQEAPAPAAKPPPPARQTKRRKPSPAPLPPAPPPVLALPTAKSLLVPPEPVIHVTSDDDDDDDMVEVVQDDMIEVDGNTHLDETNGFEDFDRELEQAFSGDDDDDMYEVDADGDGDGMVGTGDDALGRELDAFLDADDDGEGYDDVQQDQGEYVDEGAYDNAYANGNGVHMQHGYDDSSTDSESDDD
ncbi:hypothetical protein BKA62DRAFT_828936 [Auriculariales sp. MPI-PUGE-AT-0066]|nr:hypothetical protein BKA62DRAFT_828936 [Auriculariales sp. MPI-PUGE-AT-0066]